ncbi:MAG TPA: hypothetical protein VHC86_01280 [Opitutaceae bacterium]|nr:hypothetical protein [Opitutaceae bacterium]
MRQFLAVAFLSVLAFAAGYGVRIWVDQTRPVPAPPPLGAEFADGTRVTIAEPSHAAWPQRADRAALATDISNLKPQIEVFRKRQKEIDEEFDAGLDAMLTPQQKEALAARHKRQNPPPSTGRLTEHDIYWLRQQPFVYAVDHVSVEWKVKDLDRDLKFTPEQTAKVRELLKTRRQEFITLIDDVPPASLSLINLAHVAQRLDAPAAAKADSKP